MNDGIAEAIQFLREHGLEEGLANKVERHFDDTCYYCGVPTAYNVEQTHPLKKTADHRVPLARLDGPSPRGNKVTCCKACNSAKGPMTEEEYRHFLSTRTLHESFVAYLVEHTIKTQWAYLERKHAAEAGERDI